MLGNIIGFGACLMCAIPFIITAKYGKDSRNPINFWSGDATLKNIVQDVPDHNKKMAKLYGNCGISFLINGIIFLIAPKIGVVLLCMECTLGFYLVYRKYKKILIEMDDKSR